jgi:hypothetical protein
MSVIQDLESKANDLLDEHTPIKVEMFYCPHCGNELFDAKGWSKRWYLANMVALTKFLDFGVDTLLNLIGHPKDEVVSYFSESTEAASEKYFESPDDLNFDPETRECDNCKTDIRTGQRSLDSYLKPELVVAEVRPPDEVSARPVVQVLRGQVLVGVHIERVFDVLE